MKKKFLIWFLISLSIFLIILIVFVNYEIINSTEKQVFSSIDSIPANSVGLLLGTSKYLNNGKLNQYFEFRILATELLYKSGKINKIVISGDNSKKDYNEPQDMKDELIKKGIPEENIYLDYAGFRTFDSIYRMKRIFGQRAFTIISQKFHNQRAVYIANSLNLKVVGFNAKDVDAYNGFKTKVRESFARVKVMIDLILKVKPKFLGEKIIIN